LARIIALADSYDAMISDRPYRQGLSLERVQEEIETNSGTQFDPLLAEVFLRQVKMEGGIPSIYPSRTFH
jgi:HD-GYP domain-containing protein (c-di-GMP phosphodiesterase class II)